MKVSVIVVTLNEEKNITLCLETLLKQDYKRDFEVIIVDGGSKDNTHNIIKKYQETHRNLHLVVEQKAPIARSRNLGIKKAQYPLIAFTDADCSVPKDWLTTLVTGLNTIEKNNPKKKIAGVGGANIAPENPTKFQRAIGIAFSSYLGSLGSIQAAPVKKDKELFSISCSNSLHKKEALLGVNMFSEELGNQGEDWDLGAKYQKAGWSVFGLAKSFVWHNFRATPKTFWKNMVFYGDGRMLLTKKHPDMIKVKYMIPLFFIPVFIISALAFALTLHPLSLFPYAYFPFIAVYSAIISRKHPLFLPLVTTAFLIQHFGYAYGELKGLRWMFKKIN